MKIVRPAMLAAIAAMAFIGASSASATSTWIGLCTSAELLNCEDLVKHPLSGKLIALVGPSAFNAGFVAVECKSGEGYSSDTEGQKNIAFTGTLEELVFAGCKGCTGLTDKTPQLLALNMETETGGWRSTVNNIKVKFTGCPLSQTCTYEGSLNLEVQMNLTEAFTEPKGTQFKRIAAESTALCAETGKWESGKTVFDWELDNLAFPNGTRHRDIFPSLIGKELIKVP